MVTYIARELENLPGVTRWEKDGMCEIDHATTDVSIGFDRRHRYSELTEIELFWGRDDAEGIPSGQPMITSSAQPGRTA